MELIDPFPPKIDACDYCGTFRQILFIRGNSMEEHQNVCTECMTDAIDDDEYYSYYPYMLSDVEWWEETEAKYSHLDKDGLENFQWEWLSGEGF
jgi:hypothetical protein